MASCHGTIGAHITYNNDLTIGVKSKQFYI
ncbi:hypothetical protein SBV1_1990009 [Verrucomicrobia bacterium]|nr:hypothetical protein SBV1_1990009 [Verrucomicrobiota bacterium]